MNIVLIDHSFSPPGSPPTITNKLAIEIGNKLKIEIKGYQSLDDKTIQELKKSKPDAILLDMNFPDNNRMGIELIDVIKDKLSDAKIIMFTDSEVKFKPIRDALQFGAKGYICKLNPIEDIAHGIRSVVENDETFLCNRSIKIILENLVLEEPNTTELKILAALSCDETLTNQKLGEILHMVGQGIGQHLKRLYKKTRTNDKRELNVWAKKNILIGEHFLTIKNFFKDKKKDLPDSPMKSFFLNTTPFDDLEQT